MKKMWVVYAVVAVVIYLVGNMLYVAGVFKTIDSKQEGEVSAVYAGIYGPEDMDLDDSTGLLFISSADRWKIQRGLNPKDGIFVLQLDSGRQPHKVPTTYPGEFHPHGISFLRADSISLLFVVNHNASGDFVEIFRYVNDSLVHQKSIADPSMCCPNDVVAISPTTFYVTNDHGNRKGFKRTLEDYLQLPFSSLLFYDGVKFSTAFGGLKYGNGVNISNDKSKLYVAATTGRQLLTFDRDPATGNLTLVNTMKLKTGVDNVDVDEDGNLWIASHPKLLAFVGHAKDSAKLSPSEVLKLIPGPDNTYKVEQVLMDDGTLLSGSSIALRYQDQLFVGGVFQPKILRITLKK